jgi:hypothetical protein
VYTGEIVTGTRVGVGSRVLVGGMGVFVSVAVGTPGGNVEVFCTIGKNGSYVGNETASTVDGAHDEMMMAINIKMVNVRKCINRIVPNRRHAGKYIHKSGVALIYTAFYFYLCNLLGSLGVD